MADYRVPSQQANDLSVDTFPRLALHRSHGHVQHIANLHGAGDDRQDVHREGIPQPVGNVAVQGEMQYSHRIDTPNYNVAHYHPPPLAPPYPEVPYVHMHQDVGVAEAVPAQAHPFTPDFPAADPPEVFPGVWPHPAPPANMPPANGLRNLVGRYLNDPDTRVNMLRIEPGRDGRFEVWIVLELADIF